MDTQAQLGTFRTIRRELEESILPLATSIDGRAFSFQASLHGLALQVGGYVMIEADAGPRLARCRRSRSRPRDAAELALRGEDGSWRPRACRCGSRSGAARARRRRRAVPRRRGAARRRRRSRARGSSGHAPTRARLRVGELALAPGVPLALDAGGFDRHTFLCGQSGSGKTYSLGVMLERLLLETTPADRGARPELRLRAASASCGRGRRARSASATRAARRLSTCTGPRARAPTASGSGWRSSSRPLQSALLRLDPSPTWRSTPSSTSCSRGAPADHGGVPGIGPAGGQRLALRVRNLGVDRSACGRAADPGSTVGRARTTRTGAASSSTSARCHAHGAVADRCRGARRPVGAARGAPARPDRDRRGAQHLPGRAGGPARRARDRARGADRRRGAQVRALPARVAPSARRRFTRTS